MPVGGITTFRILQFGDNLKLLRENDRVMSYCRNNGRGKKQKPIGQKHVVLLAVQNPEITISFFMWFWSCWRSRRVRCSSCYGGMDFCLT